MPLHDCIICKKKYRKKTRNKKKKTCSRECSNTLADTLREEYRIKKMEQEKENDLKQCPYCGVWIHKNMRKCFQCGNDLF